MTPERDLPPAARRSALRGRHTWHRAHDAELETYGDDERTHREVFAALKESCGQGRVRRNFRLIAGGRSMPPADTIAPATPKRQLYDIARRLGIAGRSRMTKAELVLAIRRVCDG